MVDKQKLQEDAEVILSFLDRKEMTITDLARETDMTRCRVRTVLPYLIGKDQIKERRVGMAKLYKLK